MRTGKQVHTMTSALFGSLVQQEPTFHFQISQLTNTLFVPFCSLKSSALGASIAWTVLVLLQLCSLTQVIHFSVSALFSLYMLDMEKLCGL